MTATRNIKILVEGGDDAHFVMHFANRRLRTSWGVPKHVESCGDIERLLGRLKGIQNETGYERLGVIADSNADPAKRWSQLRDAIGASHVPEVFDLNGLVLPFVRNTRLGIWCMPQPGQPGGMEEFLAAIRLQTEQQSALWQHAIQSVDAIPEPRLYAAKDAAKVQLRTWLAWQKEPGASFGLALIQSAFDLEHPLTRRFESWLRRLVEA